MSHWKSTAEFEILCYHRLVTFNIDFKIARRLYFNKRFSFNIDCKRRKRFEYSSFVENAVVDLASSLALPAQGFLPSAPRSLLSFYQLDLEL